MIGKTISHYGILEELGRGGMGVVYKAEDTKLKRAVALKFLPHHLLASEDDRVRFLHEAQAASALGHPNIMTIHEIDEVDEETFIVMEYVEGETLKDKLEKGPFKTKEVLKIAISVADGLNAAHNQEIVHRDIKSENIMISKDGLVKIMDFGLARRKGETRVTKEGSTLGTLAYMSPEQAEGSEVDHRSDLFSFGVVMYEMATGQLPFKGEHDAAILYAIVNEAPLPVSTLNPNIPNELDRIIHKALEKDPEDRYQHADDLAADLKKLKKDIETGKTTTITTAIPVPRVEEKKPVRRAPAYILAAAVVAVLLIFGIQRLLKRGVEPITAIQENSLAVLYFENLGDPEDSQRLGQILQELIIADLSEVASLKVFSSQRLFDIQKQLGSRDRRKIDPEIATEVAKQAEAETMLMGKLIQAGGELILTSQLVDVLTGTVARSQRADGTDIFAMVDDLAVQIRNDLNLPATTVDRVDVAVKEKTTSSVEAYQHYLEGVDLLNRLEFDDAIVRFQKAVSVDATFNQAYYKMAIAQWWSASGLGVATDQQAEESLSHILSGSRDIPRKDRLLVEGVLAFIRRRISEGESIFKTLVKDYPDEKEGWYGLGEAYFHGSGENLKALDAFEQALKLDPEFKLAYRHIFDIYYQSGMFDRGIEVVEHYISLYPDEPSGYGQVALMYRGKGEFELAREAYQRGLSLDPEAYSLINGLGYAYQLTGQYDQALKQYARMVRPEVPLTWQETGRNSISDLYQEQGQYRKALEDLSETLVISKSIGKDTEANTIIWQALLFHFLGDTTTALTLLDSALAVNPGLDLVLLAYYWEGALHARWGKVKALSDVIDTVSQIIEREDITSWTKFTYNALLIERFELLGEVDRALLECDNLKNSKVWRDFYLHKQAMLHLARKNYSQALTITREMEEPSVSRNVHSFVYPVVFYARGRIYEAMGELDLARENYEKLLGLWQYADQEIVELQDTRRRLSRIMRLQG
ncbi:MAG: protein kinase [Candidatus Neomarinimicrobiota bacterium]